MDATYSTQQIPSRFDHQEAESRLYAMWQRQGYFHSEPDPGRKPYTIVIPPPNVTGALHLGHALNNTLQDILVRWRRMQGYNALWIPGTDHAGIATQAVVEKRLREEEGKTRHDLGREALVERIWQWKDAYEAQILSQLQALGASCDWERTRFTLDEVCARAVRQTFFDLFRKQWIYRGKRLVNWDTFLQTAVSDDEVFHETVAGHFWHFRYPVIDPRPGEPAFVSIATTRPETMLGDTAVAVHPDPEEALRAAAELLETRLRGAPDRDRPAIAEALEEVRQRQQHLLPQLVRLRDMARQGRLLRLPLLGREIPLITDPWAKPEMGSGCVKITPAHDPNDYDVGLRHELPMINILQPDGTLNEQAGPYAGLTIAEARAKVVEDLEKEGLLEKVEDREIDLAHSDRSKTPIEPYLADQWFVDMEVLAQWAIDAVVDGRVTIIPGRYAKGYLDWLGEKRDWPVSRQLWWGHRIPIWSRSDPPEARAAQPLPFFLAAWPSPAEDGRPQPVAVREELVEALSCQQRRAADGSVELMVCPAPGHPDLERQLEAAGFEQEVDVLDTWFSSALWPHSTLGWPERTPELEYYYPTSVLVTSRDIITLWVARMVLTGLNNVGEVPFRHVYIHPKILDGYGETMSKTKGNGVDPLAVIETLGADALRFVLAHMTTETQDVRMPVQFECPHCHALLEQTRDNRQLPRIRCPKCGDEFSTQWAYREADLRFPRATVVSERFEVGRNFGNKLWNVARLILMNLEGYRPGPLVPEELDFSDRWILSRLATVAGKTTEAFEGFQFAEAARLLYDFAWDEFCSTYAEMAKRRLDQAGTRPLAQRMLAHTLDQLLRLLHPIMPFLTEEIWQRLNQVAPRRGMAAEPARESVMVAAWPQAEPGHIDTTLEQQFARFQEVLGALREIRSRQGIAPRQPIRFAVRCSTPQAEILQTMEPYFASMAWAEAVAWGPQVEPFPTTAPVPLADGTVYVDLAGLIDVPAEIARNQKEAEKLEQLIGAKEKKLANANFVQRAPADVVEREREGLEQLRDKLAAVREALQGLTGA